MNPTVRFADTSPFRGGSSDAIKAPLTNAGFGEVRIFCLFCNADQNAFRESSRGAGDCAAAMCCANEPH